MAKQLTAPGCIYSIVARVDTTIYSPDQTWILDVSAGQTDFIAETNEIIIPGDAMLCRKTRQHAKDRNRLNLLGRGPGSLATFVTRAIEKIVGKGNAKVEYGAGTLTVALPESATTAQIAIVENLLDRMLPKDVTGEIGELPLGYIRVEYLANTSKQYIDTGVLDMYAYELDYSKLGGWGYEYFIGYQVKNTDLMYGCPAADNVAITEMTGGKYARTATVSSLERHTLKHSQKMGSKCYIDGLEHSTVAYGGHAANAGATEKDISLYLFGAHNADGLYRSDNVRARIYSFIAWDVDENLIGNFRPALDNIGTPCMFDTVTRKPVYKAVTTGPDFIAGLTIDQSLDLANLPVTASGNLTVSLPWDAQWDERVQNALDIASTKGWTITVQYRDPEIATSNIPTSFLESTGTQYIDTGCAFDNNTGVACTFIYTNSRYNMNVIAGREGGIDNRLYSPYFGAEGSWTIGYAQYIVTGILNPDPFRTICSTSTNFKNDKKLLVQDTELRSLDANANFSCPYTLVIFGARVAHIVSNHLIGRVFEAQISQGSEIVRSFIPALSPAGTPCLHDTISGQNFYNVGTGAFIAGFDTVEQARKLATLPDVTAETDETKKSLTVSLPLELAFDASVQSALSIANTRGWTIPVQYRESELTTKNIDADFLESTGTQRIHTEYVPNNETGIYSEWCHTAKCNGHDFGVKEADSLLFLNVRYSEEGSSGYGWGRWIAPGYWYPGLYTTIYSEMNFLNCREAKVNASTLTARRFSLGQLNVTLTKGLYLFNGGYPISGATHRLIGRIYTAKISQGTEIVRDFVPALDSTGVPCMRDTVSGQNFYNANTEEGATPFIVGFETTEKAAVSLSKLPVTTGGTLTVSLPAAAETDKLVNDAIDIATNRGWTIITQYRED